MQNSNSMHPNSKASKMANYNRNRQANGGCFDQYINFDQFLMQHNIGSPSPFYSPRASDFNHPTYNNQPTGFNARPQNSGHHAQQQQQQQSTVANGNFFPTPTDSFQSSNLLVTAPEFVPQKVTNSNLAIDADEFVPNRTKTHSNESRAELKKSEPSKDDSVVATGNKKQSPRREHERDERITESVIEKLNSTHIFDEQSGASTSLDTSGGAIKKIRNQRNNSRERQSTGNRSNRRYNGRYEDRYDDRRGRNFRENERYGGGGNRSSKYDRYDNNRNYQNKNDNNNSEEVNSNNNNNKPLRNNGRNSKDNNIQNSETSPKNDTKNSTNNKDKRYDKSESKDRKRDDPKGNRRIKVNSFKFDTSNCSQREKLIQEIDSGKLECLVCCEKIKPFHSTWSCTNCYHIMHLNCIVKWAAASFEKKSDEGGWRCCACNKSMENVPNGYYCFCGKSMDPQYNRNDIAHSCGETCGRLDGCVHPCTQLCHPGPCPPCQAMVTRVCGCEKTSKIFQCNQKNDLKCDQNCDKILLCTKHQCSSSCHFGDCDSCDKEIEQNCYCKREKRTVPCTKENNEHLVFSCGRTCNKQLKCKGHKCKDPCHPGECGSCKLLPEVIRTCPCGKMKLEKDQRLNCTDPIPLCTSVCKKPLTCGPPSNPHLCVSKCHNGPCPPCNKQTSVKCRCGHMDQMMKCTHLSTRADDARCKKRCTKKRSCGKHKCNQECCIDIDHDCPLKCPYTLSCGKHKCSSLCHKGRCLPCLQSSFEELHCECGAQVIYPPVPCGTKKPACDRPCSRQHTCNHKIMHNCHSAPSCPPCMEFTSKMCHGKHEQRKIIPCSTSSFSCGLPCNKRLKCGNHYCQKICHEGNCETETDICKQNCKKPRMLCAHQCNAPCHISIKDCPETPCREMIEILCQCGLRKQMRNCHDFSSEFKKIATAQLASSVQQMQNGGTIELSDILGPIKTSNNKTLECNEECRMAERNRRLAIGLQIRNPDTASKFNPKYSDFIRSWAKKDSKLVTMIHDKLTELVKLAKESKQRSRSHSFPIMNREKRQLVHEMCEMFGVESIAYDAEPNRNVVATAKRDTSWLPSMSIMESVQRENGQRRIPVPSVNAWGVKRN